MYFIKIDSSCFYCSVTFFSLNNIYNYYAISIQIDVHLLYPFQIVTQYSNIWISIQLKTIF